MDFIIWTFVWYGIKLLDKYADVFFRGGMENYERHWSLSVRAATDVFYLIIWIIVYKMFIEK